MTSPHHCFTKTATESELSSLASEVLSLLRSRDDKPFTLWLCGEMGTGKTTFTRYLLQALGLSKQIPVSSPTFAYLNDYEIGGQWFAHMDLFRVDASFSPEDLGLLDQRDYRGLIMEWPERIPLSQGIMPTHSLDIRYVDEALGIREYQCFSFLGSPR